MFEEVTVTSPCDFIIFGALGDLHARKLFPALYHLERVNRLHINTRIICCARDSLSLADYIEHMKVKLETFVHEPLDRLVFERLIKRLRYCSIDFTHAQDFTKIIDYINHEIALKIFYFAIPPSLYAQSCQGLSSIGLCKPPARLVLEKPIGHDLESSIAIHNKVAQFFSEDRIYRIDHYLGKEAVLNLLALRFENNIFSSNWDKRFIEKVEIMLAEEVGVEGRWGYYDKAGQIRDMMQNHILQILSLLAMDKPSSLSAEHIRQEKLKVLQFLRPISDKEINQETIRAQYLGNQQQPGYLEETGADKNSNTETFVAVKAYIDNDRWSTVPFYLMTGKRLAKKQSEIVIYFKSEPDNMFQQAAEEESSNRLIIPLQEDKGLALSITKKIPVLSSHMQLVSCNLAQAINQTAHIEKPVDAYERLLSELMSGNQSLFVSREEVELAWQWIDGIKQAWERQAVPVYSYPSGSLGPIELARLYDGKPHLWTEDNANTAF
jgi:glucose-6-phosphate 1-dehydrogenase